MPLEEHLLDFSELCCTKSLTPTTTPKGSAIRPAPITRGSHRGEVTASTIFSCLVNSGS
jgi:hypothetical protein